MNRNRIAGNLKQGKGALRKQWGRLTGNAGAVERGERERLSGKMQKTYGIRQAEAERQIRELQTAWR